MICARPHSKRSRFTNLRRHIIAAITHDLPSDIQWGRFGRFPRNFVVTSRTILLRLDSSAHRGNRKCGELWCIAAGGVGGEGVGISGLAVDAATRGFLRGANIFGSHYVCILQNFLRYISELAIINEQSIMPRYSMLQTVLLLHLFLFAARASLLIIHTSSLLTLLAWQPEILHDL